MTDTTSRHDRNVDETRDRLVNLMRQARATPREETADLPPDQRWVDVTADAPAPDPPPPDEPWWRCPGRLLERWTPPEADIGRRRMAVVLAGALVVVVLVAVGLTLSSSGAEHEPPPVLPVAASSTVAEPDTSMVVSVVGLVAAPGLVTLPDGARVADALRAAGGPVAGTDLGALNLARRLADGEQIYVGMPTPPGAEPAGGAPQGQPGVPAKVDLNSASLTSLDTLPGVGPVTAQRILDWRTEHGRFESVDQLREIEGIGPAKFAKLKDLVVA